MDRIKSEARMEKGRGGTSLCTVTVTRSWTPLDNNILPLCPRHSTVCQSLYPYTATLSMYYIYNPMPPGWRRFTSSYDSTSSCSELGSATDLLLGNSLRQSLDCHCFIPGLPPSLVDSSRSSMCYLLFTKFEVTELDRRYPLDCSHSSYCLRDWLDFQRQ